MLFFEFISKDVNLVTCFITWIEFLRWLILIKVVKNMFNIFFTYNAKINQATYAELNQAVDSHEGQWQYPAERSLSRQLLTNDTPLAAT